MNNEFEENGLAQNSEDIANDLRERIIQGVIAQGQRLVERDVAKWYAISRTPVREALKILSAEGLVVLRPNRGAEVTTFNAEMALKLFEVIAELEALAARGFAEHVTSGRLREIEERHERMRQHFERGELTDYFAVNNAIHELIIGECGNPILAEAHERLMMRARLGRHMALADQSRWEEAMDEHEQMMTVLRRHDCAAVAAIWRRHLLNSGRALAQQLNKSLAVLA
ncbi:GntR family transcriptional regulator [Breoghania corrubedonensis]|uniref:GntR family transcriptional regulator n=1 Tax=Breoghania corrubedonensis TaxID=665038 RepID=UPI001473A083|nr:GntR family transcriptional regulator [Breoghania corrubedonensis]